jgi:hypothetical protein
MSFWDWLHQHHHHRHHWRVVMQVTLGSSPTQVGAIAQYPDPENEGQFLTDPNAKIAFVLSAPADATTEPGAIATLTDNGDGTCSVSLVEGAPADAAVNLDAVATDPDGNEVSSAATGGTITLVAPAETADTDATQVVLTVINGGATGSGSGAAQAAPAPAAPATSGAAEAAGPGPIQQAAPIAEDVAPGGDIAAQAQETQPVATDAAAGGDTSGAQETQPIAGA